MVLFPLCVLDSYYLIHLYYIEFIKIYTIFDKYLS